MQSISTHIFNAIFRLPLISVFQPLHQPTDNCHASLLSSSSPSIPSSKMCHYHFMPIFLLFLLLTISATTASEIIEMTKCNPVNCGGVDISYPFWMSGSQPEYCGYPSLEVTCTGDGKPFLVQSYNTQYYIGRVFYQNSSLIVIKSVLVNWKTNCSVPAFNISLALGPLVVSQTNRELVFFSNCAENVRVNSSDYLPFTCPSPQPGSTNEFFVRLLQNYSEGGGTGGAVPGESLSNCSITKIPVLGWNGLTVNRYTTLMNDGFLVELRVASCSDCRNSKGMCGFNTSTSMFMCICPDGSASPVSCPNSDAANKEREHRTIIIGSLTAASLSLMISAWIIFIFRNKVCIFRRKYRVQKEIELLIEKYGSLAPRRYSYRELKRITKSFQMKLGKGGFGTVYKGKLPDGRFVAVKFLHNSMSNGEEFLNEVISIGRTSHVNVVSLLGFCIEGSNRALIYEYMPNGSLDKYINSENHKDVLGWEKLFDIAIGIARGIEYLHQGCNTRIVHFDIKPQNILLDENFHPRIADFGLAKLCQPEQSMISLAEMRGTIGFIAPEVFSRSFGVPSTKSDVYSYGILLLEIVGCRKNAKSSIEDSSQEYFPHWVYNCLARGDEIEASVTTLETEGIVRKMAIVGLWCIQPLSANRPSISEVVEMLDRSLEELEMPPKPYFSSPQESMTLSLNSSIS